MLQPFDAIYENGVLRPLEPLALSEHQQVRVSVVPSVPPTGSKAERQRIAMEELDAVLRSIPDNSPGDEFTAADHDRVLYGNHE
jgi:predicted DNA-binding antitoxin AbrB/MazE fold protein